MAKVHIFNVKPKIPQELKELHGLAYNLRWVWDHRSQDMFRRIDPDLWQELNNNPVAILGRTSQQRYQELLQDDGFMDHYQHCVEELEEYLKGRSWFEKTHPEHKNLSIAYFSLEFGLHTCMPVYSGGLGVLAGDHLKSCSDLGVPITGVGLLYQRGYFQQYLNADGYQQESYIVNDYANMPVTQLMDEKGSPFKIKLEFPGRDIYVQCWKVEVGRVPLYLLDTNIPENRIEDQSITDELYGGDQEKRIQQEIVLGIGGSRMLIKIGLKPDVYHMNEGHSALLGIDRIRELIFNDGLKIDEAIEVASAANVFTTHTSVPAGIDVFPENLISKYLKVYIDAIGMDFNYFMSLGRIHPNNPTEQFCMAVLALKTANHSNAVSKLHGNTSRKLWKDLYPQVPINEIPIISITNGVHPTTWISKDMHRLLNRYLGPSWQDNPHDPELWNRINSISDEELWRTHEHGREQLVAFVRERLRKQLEDRKANPAEIKRAGDVLNPEYLTIGFARRFATYKRATLLFRDPERLKKILTNYECPVQIIFAGKAHPKDEPGKELIRKIVHFSRDPEIRNRIVFLENYDITVASNMLSGIDVWLNTPRRPQEASGTSGMKAVFNGALNISVLDGWWYEGFKPNVGWTIGKGEEYKDSELQDEVESNALYDLLEKDVVPMFYSGTVNGKSREWVRYMKESMKTLCPMFSTNRMIDDYLEKSYLRAFKDYEHLTAYNFVNAMELAVWKKKLRENWPDISFDNVESHDKDNLEVEDEHEVSIRIHLGKLEPEDISVELFHGEVNEKREVVNGDSISLKYVSSEDKIATFKGKIPLGASGRFGFMARVVPNREKMLGYAPGLITWE